MSDSPAPGAKTILIVEDDLIPAMCLRDELEDAGYRVLDLTTSHNTALEVARAGKPDFALVNIELQGRDNGIALATELKAMNVPVLFISGQVSRARSAATVAVGSLPKPYSPEAMVAAVAYLMAHLNGDDSLPRPDHLEVFDTAEEWAGR